MAGEGVAGDGVGHVDGTSCYGAIQMGCDFVVEEPERGEEEQGRVTQGVVVVVVWVAMAAVVLVVMAVVVGKHR